MMVHKGAGPFSGRESTNLEESCIEECEEQCSDYYTSIWYEEMSNLERDSFWDTIVAFSAANSVSSHDRDHGDYEGEHHGGDDEHHRDRR